MADYPVFECQEGRFQPMTRPDLIALLANVQEHLERGDSFEGSVRYLMGDPLGYDGEAPFIVQAVYRIGNSMGQGGVRIIPHPTKD